MDKLIWILWSFFIALGALFLFMLLRTVSTRPKKEKEEGGAAVANFDSLALAKKLSEAVQIPTVSMVGEDADDSAFVRFHDWLKNSYPLLHERAEITNINRYSLIYYIKGSDPSLKPAAFLAHQDVVPADDEGWEVPPFSGEIKDGFVYGRGAMDMKCQLIAALEAAEYVLAKGMGLKRGLYICLGHDEEISSPAGAPFIAKHLEEKGVKLEYVVDEGGIMVDGKILGIPRNIALIGTCEKGYCDVKISVKKDGGHASNPKRPTCVGLLAKAIAKIENNPMPTLWNEPTKRLFSDLAPYMRHIFKFVMVNRDILSPLLKAAFTLTPMTNALVRTTFAPTTLKASDRNNVLPPEAEANVNVRIVTGNTSSQVKKHIQKTVGKGVFVEVTAVSEPCPVSPTDSPQYALLVKSLKDVWKGLVAAPYMFIAADDARFFYGLTDNVFRFTPYTASLDDQKRVHAINERMSVDAMAPAAAFFVRLIENTCVSI